MIIEAITQGGFFINDDRIIAIIGGYFLIFFVGLTIGQNNPRK